MKTVLKTPDRLVLDGVPWVLGGLIVAFVLGFVAFGLNGLFKGDMQGAVFLLAALFFGGVGFVAFVRRTRLDMDRGSGRVVITRRGVLGTSRLELALDEVRGAEIERSRSSKGSTTRRAVLVLADGDRQEIDPVYTSGSAPRRTANRINAWLGAPEGVEEHAPA